MPLEHAACFSSDSAEWGTPRRFLDVIRAEFGPIGLDPCAQTWNATAARFYTEQGLSQPWSGMGNVFLNPPWRRGNKAKNITPIPIEPWLRKAAETGVSNAPWVVLGLIPARTDTAWWHGPVQQALEIRLIKGRLCYMRPSGDEKNCAPFPSALVVWGANPLRRPPVVRCWDPDIERVFCRRCDRYYGHVVVRCPKCGDALRALRPDTFRDKLQALRTAPPPLRAAVVRDTIYQLLRDLGYGEGLDVLQGK